MKVFKSICRCSWILLLALLLLAGCGKEQPEAKIAIDMDEVIHVGESLDLNANVENFDLANVVWSVDDESIAKIENGKLVALKKGNVLLSAIAGKSLAALQITVLKELHEVKYDLNGGVAVSELIESRTEDDVVVLPDVERSGFAFLGWYDNADFTGEAITELNKYNIDVATVYAKFEKLYTISYEANGGTLAEGNEYVVARRAEEVVYLPMMVKEGYKFIGWYSDPGCVSNKVLKLTSDNLNINKLYAKFTENSAVKTFYVAVGESFQLDSGLDATDIEYKSGSASTAKISEIGVVTGLKVGDVIVTATSKSLSKTLSFNVKVVANSFFEISYETASYVKVGSTIKLNAEAHSKEGLLFGVTWKSLDEGIASVDENGNVKGIAPGYVKIRAISKGDSSVVFDMPVTVVGSDINAALKFVLDANEANVFVRKNLGIGAGTPDYYMDIIGSISKVLYNHEYKVDTRFEKTQAKIDSNHGGKKTSTEFITVHYTGNMSAGANASANASYFANGGSGTSIHYVTGNDGIFHVLDDSLVGFHAGDGTSAVFEWYPTGVKYKATDPTYPVWGISENSKFTLNGKETTVSVPTGTTPETTRVTSDTFVSGGVEQPCINDLGLPFKVENGEYYMGTTYWCYTQIKAGRICSHGGNNNSIGIESCVNKGSDLWLTWNYTAELVARLMKENNLDITRVWGHYFYSAKDCPQPMLENDNEIWWKFIDMVKAENKMITTFNDYTFEMSIISETDLVDSNGRVSLGDNTEIIEYQVVVKDENGIEVGTVRCASAINSQYLN